MLNTNQTDFEMVKNALHTAPENLDIADDGACYGVNLAFLRNFIKVNQIPSSDMTTAEVVERYIKPQTLEAQSAFMNKIFPDKQFWTDLRPNRRKIAGKKGVRCFFLSHCWQMPFHCLVNAVENATEIKHNFFTDARERTWDFYFWIDIFCKNQHLPAPAMDEFKNAMKSSGI
jgi:hypothetical protein